MGLKNTEVEIDLTQCYYGRGSILALKSSDAPKHISKYVHQSNKMAQTQMCTNDNFDDSNRTPIMKILREAPKIGTSRFFN